MSAGADIGTWHSPWGSPSAPALPESASEPVFEDSCDDGNRECLTDLPVLAIISPLTEPADAGNTDAMAPIEVHVTLETTLGLLAAFFIGFFAPTVLMVLSLIALLTGRMPLLALLLPLLLSSSWLAILIARMAAEASMGRLHDPNQPPPAINRQLPTAHLPFALAMAARMPVFSSFWRPWIAVWWISHFCAAAALGHFAAIGLIHRLDVATILVAVPLAVVIHFAFLFAANLYLVLASRALHRSPRLCVRIWKQRYVIDFVIACLLLLRGWN